MTEQKRNPTARINKDLFNLRKMHKDQLSKALNGMHIQEIDIDSLYTRKLKNVNILEEFFKPKQ